MGYAGARTIARGTMVSAIQAVSVGGAAMRSVLDFAWDGTPIGAPETWTQSLRTAVDLMLGSGLPSALFIGPQLTQMHNQAFGGLYGQQAQAARDLGRSVGKMDPQGPLAAAAVEVFAGRSVALHGQAHPLGDAASDLLFSLYYAPFRDERGEVVGMSLLVVATGRAAPGRPAGGDEPDDRRALLGELQHRVRNILAVVRSLIARSAETSETVEDLVAHLDGRIAALARIQAVLVRNPGVGVDLEGLVREELLAQSADERRLAITGPEVALASKAAELMTLAAHELATNATKYGALSQPDGRLEISWRIRPGERQDWLELRWAETGVRILASAPRREGFGVALLKRRLPYELGGRAVMDFRPGGLVCEMTFPLGSDVPPAKDQQEDRR
jgi:two-component sensor histidine kinase